MAVGAPRRPSVLNLPNQLTLARFGLALVLFVLIEWHQWFWCVGVFAVAAVTDWLDGYLARRQGLTSSLGRNLDPLVDKVLVCGAFIFLLPVPGSGLAAWMVAVVVARELVITGLRGYMESQGAKFGADWLGKVKMGLQCVALFAIFLVFGAEATGGDFAARSLVLIRDVSVWGMAIATLASGLQYLWRAALLLKDD